MLKKAGYFLTGVFLVLGLIVAINFAPAARAVVPGTNTLISVNNTGDGQGGNGSSPATISSLQPAGPISADGRYVAFISHATNLVANDTNGWPDIFVRDLSNSSTERVSVSTTGIQANERSGNSNTDDGIAISSNGRYVAYTSWATNLIDGQTSPISKVYLRDRLTGTTTMVNQLSDGTVGSGNVTSVVGVSSDGRFVTYTGKRDLALVPSQTNTASVFVYVADLSDRSFQILNPTPTSGQYFVSGVSASCDGSIIAFSTKLSFDANDTDSSADIYLSDLRNTKRIVGITIGSNSTYNATTPSLSCNGDFLTFTTSDPSFASLTIPIKDHSYLYDRVAGQISLVDTSTSGVVSNGAVSSVSGVDNKGNVAFSSNATNLRDGYSTTNSQVYMKHHGSGVLELVSIPISGQYSNGVGGGVSITEDGSAVTYYASGTTGTDLLTSDTNGKQDVIHSLTGL